MAHDPTATVRTALERAAADGFADDLEVIAATELRPSDEVAGIVLADCRTVIDVVQMLDGQGVGVVYDDGAAHQLRPGAHVVIARRPGRSWS